MKFYIVTASYRQPGWLKRCVRSIGDQASNGDAPDFAAEHVIQDGGTGPELEAWVREHSRARLFVEKDSGMYDALNRGFEKADGDILGFLNCDEQYLPETLRRVAAVFREQPQTDIVSGDYLIVGADGDLLSFRRATPLRAAMILTDHLYNFTCATFFRRRVWERTGPFRTDLPAVGDAEWVARALRKGARAVCLRRYLSAFTLTGQNLSLHEGRQAEARKLRELTPAWVRLAGPVLRRWRHLEKLAAGGYRSGPIPYEIYARDEDEERTRFVCERPVFRHPWA
ncbi:MAG TPA: glycosyltransferase [Chthoniobacteraceae bacterium]